MKFFLEKVFQLPTKYFLIKSEFLEFSRGISFFEKAVSQFYDWNDKNFVFISKFWSFQKKIDFYFSIPSAPFSQFHKSKNQAWVLCVFEFFSFSIIKILIIYIFAFFNNKYRVFGFGMFPGTFLNAKEINGQEIRVQIRNLRVNQDSSLTLSENCELISGILGSAWPSKTLENIFPSI